MYKGQSVLAICNLKKSGVLIVPQGTMGTIIRVGCNRAVVAFANGVNTDCWLNEIA